MYCMCNSVIPITRRSIGSVRFDNIFEFLRQRLFEGEPIILSDMKCDLGCIFAERECCYESGTNASENSETI